MSDFDRVAHLLKARHSISTKCRNCGEPRGKHKEYCIVEVGQRIMNERDRLSKIVAAQDEIIQRYARHERACMDEARKSLPCTCGLSAALAALRKLQDGG